MADEEVVWLLDGLLVEQAPNRATGTASKAAAVTVVDFDMASGVPGIAVVKPPNFELLPWCVVRCRLHRAVGSEQRDPVSEI